MDKNLFFYELEGRGYTFQNKNWDEVKHGFEDDMLNMAWEMWQASANREGFVLVPKEPTEKMLKAIYDNKNSTANAYKAMIKAREQSNEL